MKKIEIKRDVERYLEKNLSIEEDIIDKIKKCLGEYLVVNINFGPVEMLPQPLDNARSPIGMDDAGLTRSREVAKGDS